MGRVDLRPDAGPQCLPACHRNSKMIPRATVARRSAATSVFHAVRRLRRLLLQVDPGARRSPADFARAASSIVWLVRFFYLFATVGIAYALSYARIFNAELPFTTPLWPIHLLDATIGSEWLGNTSALSVAAPIVGLLAVVFPGVLIFRLGVFLYLFLAIAVQNSYGSINHGQHFYIYISFALLFLPATIGKPEDMPRRDAMACIGTFWLVQAVMLLPYSLSGSWKVLLSNFELLAPDGMVRILLARLMDDVLPVPVLLPVISQQEYLAQLLVLGAVYCQLFAILALFRPHLHRPLGIALILFHFGTDWLVGFLTINNVLFIGLFLIFSPMAPARFSVSGMMKSLPILGIPLRLWDSLQRSGATTDQAWLVYDGECPFCKNYARYLDVKNAVGDFVLINARAGGPLVQEIRDLPYDLNEGMVLKLKGRYYFGSDALYMLALLSDTRGAFSILNRLLFSSRDTARLGYPLLKLGRHLLLKMKGVSRIAK